MQQVVHIAAFACVPAYTALIVSFHKAILCMLNSSLAAPCGMSLNAAVKLSSGTCNESKFVKAFSQSIAESESMHFL